MMTFPEYDDWTPPWEKNGEEFDEAKARRLIYNLQKAEVTEKAKRQDLAQKLQEIQAATEQQQGGQQQSGQQQGGQQQAENPEIAALRQQVAQLVEVVAGAMPQKLSGAELEAAKLSIAMDKGLTRAQALRLVGTTTEELAADADTLRRELGMDDDGDDPNNSDDQRYDGANTEDRGEMPRRLPRVRGDLGPRGGGGDQQDDPSKVRDLIPSLGS